MIWIVKWLSFGWLNTSRHKYTSIGSDIDVSKLNFEFMYSDVKHHFSFCNPFKGVFGRPSISLSIIYFCLMNVRELILKHILSKNAFWKINYRMHNPKITSRSPLWISIIFSLTKSIMHILSKHFFTYSHYTNKKNHSVNYPSQFRILKS